MIAYPRLRFSSAFFIFAAKRFLMGYDFNDGVNGYVKRCLECGEPLPYGRTDKLYCSESCKNRWHYVERRQSIRNRSDVMKILGRNYSVLRDLLHENIMSLDITQMIFRGFNPGYMTGCLRRPRYSECSCFDIRYNLTDSRIFAISRM